MLRSYYICWGGVCVLGLLGVKEIGYFQRPNTHNLGVAKPTNLNTWWLTRNCKLHWKSTNLSTWWLTRNCKICIELAQSVIKSCRQFVHLRLWTTMWSNSDMKEKHLIQTAIIDLQQEQEKSDNLEIIGFFTSQGRKSILGVHKNKDIFFCLKLKFIMFESQKNRLRICTQLFGALIIDESWPIFSVW